MKQSQNDVNALNDAILGGVLGLSVVFLSVKDYFSPYNQYAFLALILVYVLASVSRIFGIILDSEKINNLCIHYCRIILIPYTVWATTYIFITQMGLPKEGVVFAYYFMLVAFFAILETYGINLKFKTPVSVELDKDKLKKKMTPS